MSDLTSDSIPKWLQPLAIFDDGCLKQDMAVCLEEGYITALKPLKDLPSTVKPQLVDHILAPGLFDIQVNGGGGVMLNNQPNAEGVRALALAHRSLGTAFTLPTVITDTPNIMEKAAIAVLEEAGKNGVLGVHIEGPHIHLAKKGTHNPDFIRPFDERTLNLLTILRDHHLPVLLTLAPECVDGEIIERLTAMGVVVSAGHSLATAEQAEMALAKGLRCFTHLFNAMSPMASRAPGLVGAAINSDVWCSFIADGYHVDKRMLALAIRARPIINRMIVVSDAMSTVGGPHSFELYGETIKVEGGRLVNASGSLAGAHIDLKTSLEYLINEVKIPINDAFHMATYNPRDLMSLPHQSLIGSKLDDVFFAPIAK